MSDRTITNIKEIAKIVLFLAFIALCVGPPIVGFYIPPDYSHDE